eukprot:TRINITY_DN1697_c0_g1_i1.p1 TRINITY_DN1697_c0_g1~~TRINITY_DN1697_c0_g1_i1.p1  ORF type:complete len:229 (+),score=42.99 TRINITY_DN1697_c0_g1_i1:110-796(+)
MGVVEFVTVLIPSAIIGVVWSLVFCCMRKRKPEIYTPKIHIDEERNEIPALSDGFLGWIPDLLRIREYEVFDHSGLDAVVYLRALKMCFQIFVVSATYLWVILIPVYATSQNNDKDVKDELELLSLANVNGGSKRLWASFVGVYFVTGVVCSLIYKHYSELAEMAIEHRLEERVENYSAMISELPDDLQDTELLRDYFSQYPGDLSSLVLCENVQTIDRKKRNELQKN